MEHLEAVEPQSGSNGWCTIVAPCYNEAARLQTAIFRDFLRRGHRVRFLFVNDGSSDGTLQILETMRRGFEGFIEILNKPTNAGKGEAVRNGILQAIREGNAEFVGFWDADLATPLQSILDLRQQLVDDSRIQMVFAARVRLLGRAIHRQPLRHYLGRVFATVVSTMIQLPVYDTQCGAKLFRSTPEISQLFAEPFISRWVFDVEILARYIQQHGYRMQFVSDSVSEFPLKEWNDVAGSKVRPKDFVRAFLDVMRIHQKYME